MSPVIPGDTPTSVRGDYSWGCCVNGLHFLYIYGPTPDYRAAVARGEDGNTSVLHKGRGCSLYEVKRLAEDAAMDIAEMYHDIGSVNVVSTGEFLRRSTGWMPTAKGPRLPA